MGAAAIVDVVLTGGPCAGKSSAMARLRGALTARGWRVLTPPEPATLLIGGGVLDFVELAVHDRPRYLRLQRDLIELALDLRARFRSIAEALQEPCVLLHDRGALDSAAYLTAAEFDAIVDEIGLTADDLAELYDAVLHLRSAATTEAYTTANNAIRSESAEQAAALDALTLRAWLRHPHLQVIGNADSFEVKLDAVEAAVLDVVGHGHAGAADSLPVEVERKFRLDGPPDLTDPLLAEAVVWQIEQRYIDLDGQQRRIRKQTGVSGHSRFTMTTKRERPGGGEFEVEVGISAGRYEQLCALQLAGTGVVRKQRRVFVHADRRLELDCFDSPASGWLCEVEVGSAGGPVDLPRCLGPVQEVTGDVRWRNRTLAEQAAT